MHDWCINKEKKLRKQSHTPGKQKGQDCQADHMKKYFAKTARSYKHRDYPKWLAKTRESSMR